MSRTFELVCHECKVALWVGQSAAGHGHIYSTPEAIESLGNFLFAHQGHNLEFGDDEAYGYDCVGDDQDE